MFKFAVIDLFSGAGGVTTGIELAEVMGQKVADVICAINHDKLAIESHKSNHPNVLHFVEDIRTFDVKKLPAVIDPSIKKFLWGSLECTNFSIAKGGLSRDADSRTLAEHLFPYIKEFDPDYIGIENVKEFREWGPLVQKLDKDGNPMFDKNNKPYMVTDKEKRGIYYKRWLKKICSLGYYFEARILNSADYSGYYSVYTSRRRLFILFAKTGLPIAWPKPTHDKYGRYGLPKWKPVKDVLNFEDKGENIFGRKKNLCDNTYRRIYAGLVKYIANGEESFINQYNTAGDDRRIYSTNEQCNTLTTSNRFSLIQPEFLMKYYSGDPKNKNTSLERPADVIRTKDCHALVQTEFLIKYHGHGENLLSTEEPCSTLSTKDRVGVITTESFIDMQHGSGQQHQSINEPCGAILPVIKKNLVTAERLSFIDQQFGESKPSPVEEPCNALTANPKYNLVNAFLFNPQFQSKGGGIEDPCFTLLATMNKKPPSMVSAYVMNTSYNNKGVSIEEPCFSLLASRRHPYLIQLESGEIAIKVDAEDTEYMKKIKMFMAAYGIIAIYMRMLRIEELKDITGLPKGYILMGTEADKKKFIGNAVPPVLPKSIFEALYKANNHELKLAI